MTDEVGALGGASGWPLAPGYCRELDGLRALAVGAVLASHLTTFVPAAGGMGVSLFFVLSGYLITEILLRCRILVQNGQSVLLTLRQFYIRRGLRIFPIFYFVLIVGAAVGAQEILAQFWWNASYLANFHSAVADVTPLTAHFWSLAIEEQFYLIWPALVVLAPRRYLVIVVLGVIAAAPLFRVTCGMWFTGPWPEFLTPGVIDGFAFGALVCLASGNRWVSLAIRWFGPIGLVLSLLLCVGLGNGWDPTLLFALQRSWCGIGFAWLVDIAVHHRSRLMGWVFGAGALAYIGQISYGIYVFHPFARGILGHIAARIGMPAEGPFPAILIVMTTIAAAAASWHGFEKPINELKRRFPYAVRQSAATVSEPQATPAGGIGEGLIRRAPR
jgi:peptidoglycan/LPS O-acetylase OafA/YrhL